MEGRQPEMWTTTASVTGGPSRVVPALWADHPRLTAGSTVRIFEAFVPGVIILLIFSFLV
jgi:hypothetical protein